MSPLAVDRTDAVLTIALDRPDVFNAFDDELGGELISALQDANDPSVRCVVITGKGKAFCSGEDLRALMGFYDAGQAPDLSDIIRRRYNPVISALQSLTKPVIASVNGVAAGAGVSLALACDYRIMAEEASLVLAFPKIGLVPDSAAVWLLERYIGVGRAMEWSLSGDAMKAERALELGLVNQVVPAAKLEETTRSFAEQLSSGPTLAYGLIKQLVWESSDTSLEDQLEKEAVAQGVAGSSSDHLEGVKAFTEKRAAVFKGL